MRLIITHLFQNLPYSIIFPIVSPKSQEISPFVKFVDQVVYLSGELGAEVSVPGSITGDGKM